MFKHLISELKEALVCLQPGRVTLGYPFSPHAPEGEFRGLPQFDFELCIGCSACANACPARLIAVQDREAYRQITALLTRCTYCGRCRDVCPTKAIAMSPAFETATPNLDDLKIEIWLKILRCRECGGVIGTERAIQRTSEILREDLGINPEDMSWSALCFDCRRRASLLTPALMEELRYEWLDT